MKRNGSLGKLCLASALAVAPPAFGADPPEKGATAPAPPPANPPKLAVGKQGSLGFGALVQLWGFFARQDDEDSTTFRIRRAELKLKGDVIPDKVLFTVMIDPAKVLDPEEVTVPVENQEPAPTTPGTVTVSEPPGVVSMLQDVSITYRFTPYADVTAGQFKTPISLEGYGSSSKLLFPERALVSRRYGDKRDIGVKIDKQIDRFYYNVGIYNGQGQNHLDSNDQKNLAARFEAKVIPELLLAVAGQVAVGERDTESAADRFEGDARFELDPVVVQAEYIRAWDGPKDDRTRGHGYYGAAGVRILDFQPVVRIGQIEPDLDGDGTDSNDLVNHYELGVNYYLLDQEARFGASASYFDFDDGPSRTEIIAMAQASF